MFNWIDVGCDNEQRCNYPLYTKKLCKQLLHKGAMARGILICGSGIGMSIAANRHPGIFAALCWNEAIAKKARADDNANILILPADEIDTALAIEITRGFMNTDFKEGVYRQRLCMIDEDNK